jgi:hypothetical protein
MFKEPILDTLVSQQNQIRAPSFCFFEIGFDIILLSFFVSLPSGLHLSGVTTKICMHFVSAPNVNEYK